MAVAKMKKMTVIADAKKESIILQAMQEAQAIEVKDFAHDSVDQQTLHALFDQSLPSTEKKKRYADLLADLQECLLFMTRFSSGDAQLMKWRRHEQTLLFLEDTFDEAMIQQATQEILALKEALIENERQKKRCTETEDWLSKWQRLDLVPTKETLRSSVLVLGMLNSANQADFLQACAQLPEVYVEEMYTTISDSYYSLIFLKEHQSRLAHIFSQYHFQLVNYPYDVLPKEAYQQVQQELNVLTEQEKTLKQQLARYQKKWQTFCYAEEMLHAYLAREEAKQHVLAAPHFFLIQGWIPTEELPHFQHLLAKAAVREEVYIHLDDPTEQEIADIPIQLTNPSWVAPFEMLTEMYSLPQYEEVDPTPLMTPFYLVFFGMMVADVGYGLLMLLGTLFLLSRRQTLTQSMARFCSFFYVLSFPTILWGLIYGSFFGAELPFHLLSTTKDVNTILLLSVAFGLIQLLTGLLVQGVGLAKKKQYLASINQSFAWQGLLIGLLVMVLANTLWHSQEGVLIGGSLAGISACLIVGIPMLRHTSKAKGLAKGLYDLYGLTGYIGDLVSYTRLMALGISGGSIAAAFNMLVAFMPPVARFTVGLVLLVVLHLLNIFLSLLGAYVHGARLQYVEFFGKFYSGGGRAFAPLKAKEKYINIKKYGGMSDD